MILSNEEKNILLSIAFKSIEYKIKNNRKYKIEKSSLTSNLKKNTATFVTLYVNDELHGCIGSLKAFRPLAEDVLYNAFSAAFEDYRFNPVKESDLNQLKVEISLLSEPVRILFESEADLLEKITMYKDGLIMKSGKSQATFLPSVWEKLPDKVQFLQKLKEKAGLPSGFWSDQIEFFKYNVIKIS
ncbi:MAG: AmmeMemoRadiSam system protein A [Spirochaetia bacterium]|nr:AmmeMemoRadiSam system protein A [Spirochaetia bacterium]